MKWNMCTYNLQVLCTTVQHGIHGSSVSHFRYMYVLTLLSVRAVRDYFGRLRVYILIVSEKISHCMIRMISKSIHSAESFSKYILLEAGAMQKHRCILSLDSALKVIQDCMRAKTIYDVVYLYPQTTIFYRCIWSNNF